MNPNNANEVKTKDSNVEKRDEFGALNKDKPEEIKEAFIKGVGLSVSKEFSGPLPAPEDLAGYEKCCPGAAERIISMAEKEQNYRHNRDDKVITIYDKNENKGMNFAFIVTMTFLIAGIVAVFKGKSVEGFAILTPVIIQFFVHIFKNFKDSNSKDEENNTNNEKESS